MEFIEAVKKRRSIRRYTDKQVPDKVIDNALQAALLAPNSSNMQPWEFYWVQSPDKKKKLIEACLSQGSARTAAHLVVAVARIDTWKRNRDIMMSEMHLAPEQKKLMHDYYYKIIPFTYFHDPFGILGIFKWIILQVVSCFRPLFQRPATRRDLFEVVIKTTALACENFMLSATAQGYGSCPMEGFDERRVKKILKLGYNTRVVMVMSVGETDPKGIFGSQYRISSDKFIFKV